eukprot:608803-Prymnesium_polylepis.1
MLRGSDARATKVPGDDALDSQLEEVHTAYAHGLSRDPDLPCTAQRLLIPRLKEEVDRRYAGTR